MQTHSHALVARMIATARLFTVREIPFLLLTIHRVCMPIVRSVISIADTTTTLFHRYRTIAFSRLLWLPAKQMPRTAWLAAPQRAREHIVQTTPPPCVTVLISTPPATATALPTRATATPCFAHVQRLSTRIPALLLSLWMAMLSTPWSNLTPHTAVDQGL